MSNTIETQGEEAVRYSRVLRLIWVVALGASISVGVGIYTLPGLLMQATGGQGLGTAWVVLAIIAVPIILTYAERAAVIPGGGGAYALARQHNKLALTYATGWVLLAGYASLIALAGWGIAIHAHLLILTLFDRLTSLPWLAAFSISLVALLSVSGRYGRKHNYNRYVYVSIVTLCFFILHYLFGSPSTGSTPLFPNLLQQNTATLARISALLAAGLWGLNYILSARDEIRRPTRTISRAMLLIVGLQSLLGILATLTIMRYPQTIRNPLTPLAEIAFSGGNPDTIMVILYALSGLLITVIALHTGIVSAMRLLGAMINDGFLPNRQQSPSDDAAPPVAFVFMILGSIALVTLLPTMTLVGLASLTFLWTAALVHAPDVLKKSPDLPAGRRLKLPFHPLFPGLTLAIGIFFSISLPSEVVWYGMLWMVLGALFFTGYARRSGLRIYRQAVIVGDMVETIPSISSSSPTSNYRVLVTLTESDTAPSLIQMAAQLARAGYGSLLVLKVLVFAEQMPFHLRRQLARQEWEALESLVNAIDATGVPIRTLVRIAPDQHTGILDTVYDESIALLVLKWTGTLRSAEDSADHMLDAIIKRGACDIAILRGELPPVIREVLVATAGGSHAPLALALGQILASATQGQIKLLYVDEPACRDTNQAAATMQATREAARQIFKPATLLAAETAPQRSPVSIHNRRDTLSDGMLTIALASEQSVASSTHTPDIAEPATVPQVVVAGDIKATILTEAASADLLLIGASKQGFLEQSLFGGLAAEVAYETTTPTIITRYRETGQRILLQRFLAALSDILPTLTMSRRSEVYQDMRVAARPSVDFFVLITLAAIIASLGLIQNSAAVIIGAMLVAPLMSPILSMAMSIVQGDVRMLATAAEATIQGIALAVLVGVTMTVISPLGEATSEILARTQPNILDLLVALASGAAAGYALSRKEVAAALPGVAIAAALVPPLCVVGFGLATSQLPIAIGASLLFITNLIAIIFSAAIIFVALGFHPERTERQDVLRRLRFTIGSLGVVFLVLLYSSGVTLSQINRQIRIEDIFADMMFARSAEVRDMTIERVHHGFRMHATVIAYEDHRLTPDQLTQLQTDLSTAVGAPVKINATIIQGSRKSLDRVTRESRAAELFASLVAPDQAQVEQIVIRSAANRFNLAMTVVVFGDNAIIAEILATMQAQLSEEFGAPVAIDATIISGQRSKLAIPTQMPRP